jgi:hypothetical protein
MASATLSKPRQDSTPLRRLRAVDASTWAKLAFALLCVLALIGYFAFPTYPTYDSFYALLWGRDLLHLHLPDFRVYRGPTEHPLAIAFGMFSSLFGQGGARLMVFGSIASFVALVAGVYRLARLCFGPVVGMFAALLMLSRFFDENLAAQGYLDISYIALIVWAVALEVEKPRRGTVVFLLLAAAGLLRPDAWVLSGVYWLWCAWPARGARAQESGSPGGRRAQGAPAIDRGPVIDRGPAVDHRKRLEYLALAAIAPLIWFGADAVVTGNPLYSLHSTAGLAQELGRTQGFSSVVTSVWTYSVRIDKLPVVLGGLIGVPIAVWLAPRRVLVPLVVLVLLVFVFVAEGAAGASVIDRYLMGAATVLLIFCAVTIGGWAMLEPGGWLRRAWMVGAALANPAVKAELRRCPLVSLPDNKLIPDARWILDSTGQRDIVARSQARADADKGSPALENRIRAGSVAVYPLGSAVFFEAIVDVGDDPRDQIPLASFKRIFTSRYYAVYGNC